MSAQLKALYELQTIDLQLAKAQKAKASMDDGSAKKKQVDAARIEADKAEKLLHEATSEMRDKELNLKTVETKQKTFRDKLYAGSVTNPKELSSMEKEIEMLGRQKGKLEERLLELMDIIEERKAVAKAALSALKQQEEEYAAYLAKLKQDSASLSSKIRELIPQHEKAAEAVDPILLKRYEALRTRLSGVVVSKVDVADCSACHTKIQPGILREVKSDAQLQTCDNCSRLLYFEE